MEATFSLTRDDFSRLQKLAARRLGRRMNHAFRVVFTRVAAWMFIGLAFLSWRHLVERHPQAAWPAGLFGLFAFLALAGQVAGQVAQLAWMRRNVPSTESGFLKPQTVRLSDTAVTIDNHRGVSELRWTAFLAVEEDARNHYLFLDLAQAVIIPKSSPAPFAAALERHLAGLKKAKEE